MDEIQFFDYEKKWWHRLVRRFSLLLALQAVFATVLGFYAGYYFSSLYHFPMPNIAGLWCAISSIVVLQVLLNDSRAAAWIRIFGSFTGCFWAALIGTCFGYSVFTLAIGVFCTVISLSLLREKESFRLGCLTVQVVMIVGMMSPTLPAYLNAASRFIESVLGTVVAIIVTAAFHFLRVRFGWIQK